MSDFLLELLSEEIPARMQEKACADLARLFADEIAKAGVAAAAMETYATPRRLALIARGLPHATEGSREETKGPRASAPPQALEGFLRKTGLAREELVERDGVLFAVIEKPGRATADVLAAAVPAIVRGFPWPKSMRWGEASYATTALRWVRPLQRIVALFDGEIVPLEVDGIVSGRETNGHRFHHPGSIAIGSAGDYAAKLREARVILDPAERRDIIRTRAAALAAEAGLAVVPDEGLVAENAGLTEWPVPLLGRFDPAFLEVPREVIQLTMRTNQKYFACVDGEGRLAPAFICTANIAAADGGAAIVAGNGKVLAARLSDARFFWEQDRKVPLATHAKKLDQIVFHEKLGTVADKVDRVAKLARWLVEEGIVGAAVPSLAATFPFVPSEVEGRAVTAPQRVSTSLDTNGVGDSTPSLADMAEQAARLCKADLVTGMVGEFPELQGVMGGYYARAEGYPSEVADAIRDHYKPVGQGDDVPTAPVTVAVSLADKLDTLVGFFANGLFPTGSRDPYALRRYVLGVIRLALANNLRMDLDDDISDLIGQFFHPLDDPSSKPPITIDWPELARDPNIELKQSGGSTEVWRNDTRLLTIAGGYDSVDEISRIDNVWDGYDKIREFLAERLRVMLISMGYRHDMIGAASRVLWNGTNLPGLGGLDFNPVRILARVKALQAFVATEDGANLLAGYRRAANIVRIEAKKDADAGVSTSIDTNGSAYEREPAEAALIAALDAAEPAAGAAVAQEDFEGAMQVLARLRPAVDAFFDQVTVNDPDRDKRAARLALLDRIRAAVHNVADFSKIEG